MNKMIMLCLKLLFWANKRANVLYKTALGMTGVPLITFPIHAHALGNIWLPSMVTIALIISALLLILLVELADYY